MESVRDRVVLALCLLVLQVHFGPPTAWAAFEKMTVMEQPVEHSGDRRAIAQKLSPVLHGPVTTFLKHWLDNGEVIPLTTNAIESAFSQVNNRIKRVGRRWSEQGLLNWLKVTFDKIFKPELWSTLWNGEKDSTKIKLTSLQISWRWSNAIT